MSPGRLRAVLMAAVFGPLGVISGVTFCWILWGVLTPGDSFGGGAVPFLVGTLAVAGSTGAYAAAKSSSRLARAFWVAATIMSALYWLAAPSGWWATPPPVVDAEPSPYHASS